ncbi:MAG: MBL fold metallo-hydrolase [Pseudomonadota bacterium]
MARSILAACAAIASCFGGALAQDGRPENPVAEGLYGPLDMYPGSALYSKPIEVAPGVWSAIGATQPATYENGGHNNNLSFVIGDNGVLVVNGGSNAALAEALHDEIRAVTDKPVLYAAAENGQGHAMLGMSYWKSQGVPVIAQTDGADVFAEDAYEILDRMKTVNKEVGDGTEVAEPDQTFDEELVLDLGGVTAQLVMFGPAHSPGDMSVIVPERNVIIAGDMAFHVRMPPIFEDTDTAGWLESWELFREEAEDRIIIPGHGGPTDFATVDAGTRVYVEFLRAEVQKILDADGTLQDAYEIDQSQYKHWHTYWELAARNAGRVFETMEFE